MLDHQRSQWTDLLEKCKRMWTQQGHIATIERRRRKINVALVHIVKDKLTANILEKKHLVKTVFWQIIFHLAQQLSVHAIKWWFASRLIWVIFDIFISNIFDKLPCRTCDSTLQITANFFIFQHIFGFAHLPLSTDCGACWCFDTSMEASWTFRVFGWDL